MDSTDCLPQTEWTKRATAAILADALVAGIEIFDNDGEHANADAFDVVTKALVDLRRASGAAPEVMCSELVAGAWTCQNENQRREYADEARRIAAKTGSASMRRTVFDATRCALALAAATPNTEKQAGRRLIAGGPQVSLHTASD